MMSLRGAGTGTLAARQLLVGGCFLGGLIALWSVEGNWPAKGQVTPRLIQNSSAPPMQSCFGKASHVFVGAVTEATVYRRGRVPLPDLPDVLAKNHVLELTIHVERAVTPAVIPDTVAIRLSAPGLNVPAFVFNLTRDKQIFFLKKTLLPPPNQFYYPADHQQFAFPKQQLAEVEQLASLRKKNTPTPPSGLRNYYRVPGHVPVIDQEGGFRCWLAVSAMLLSWRDQKVYTMEQAERIAGQKANPDEDNGLEAGVKDRVLQKFGLTAEAPQSYTARGLRELLMEHGPIWVTPNVSGDTEDLLPHARLVIAVDDDTEGELRVTCIDPAGGKMRNRQKYTDLLKELEELARGDLAEARRKGKARPSDQPFRPQIIHF